MGDKKQWLQFDKTGEDVVRQQINEAYHSGVVDGGLLEEYSNEFDDINLDEDPKE